MDNELENLLGSLKNDQSKPTLTTKQINLPAVSPNNTNLPILSASPKDEEDNLSEFIIKNSKQLINHGMSAVNDLKDAITQTIDAEEIKAFAEVIKSTNGSMEILNKLNINNKKIKLAKELKKSDPKMINSGNTQNNIFVGTREDILKRIKAKQENDRKHVVTINSLINDIEKPDIDLDSTKDISDQIEEQPVINN